VGGLEPSSLIEVYATDSGVTKGGHGCMSPPSVAAGNFFQIYYFRRFEFVCILFSRIFSICLRILGVRPRTSWTLLGDLRPTLLSPVANSWLRLCFKLMIFVSGYFSLDSVHACRYHDLLCGCPTDRITRLARPSVCPSVCLSTMRS